MVKAIEHADKILEHLKYLDELAVERSPYINETLPFVVMAVEKVRESLVAFREGL